MITPHKTDALHKIQMFRLLKEILQHPVLGNQLYFKGGTYAALSGVLDRFSVDLDFDLPNNERKSFIRSECHLIFKKLNFVIKDESKKHLQFFIKYPAKKHVRNTLKLEITDLVNKYNIYTSVFLREINMFCHAQSKSTMFANKLVAATARYHKNGKIAGRDFYDLHYFFLSGLSINKKVVESGTGKTYLDYLQYLLNFIKSNVSQTLLNQDLNTLLPTLKLNTLLPNLKEELLFFINNEVQKLDPKKMCS